MFKNAQNEDKASSPDTPEDPITFDTADQELQEAYEKENELDAADLAKSLAVAGAAAEL